MKNKTYYQLITSDGIKSELIEMGNATPPRSIFRAESIKTNPYFSRDRDNPVTPPAAREYKFDDEEFITIYTYREEGQR